MKKWLLVPIVAAMLGVMLLGGCTGFGGVSQEDFAQLEAQLSTMSAQVAELSAISAYNVWYDQYYAGGNYVFADVESFNTKLGALVGATGDGASATSWDTYLATDTALNDVVSALPEDATTWTEEQYNQWLEVSTTRYNALGEVGTALFNTIVQ